MHIRINHATPEGHTMNPTSHMHPNSYTRLGRTGRMRLTLECPNCGGMVHIRGTTRISTTCKKHYIQCIDIKCGWMGYTLTETVATILAPATLQAGYPPKISTAEIDDFIEDGKLF